MLGKDQNMNLIRNAFIRSYRLAVFLVVLFLGFVISPQWTHANFAPADLNRGTQNFANWTALFINGKINDHFGYFVESQSRINDGSDYTNRTYDSLKSKGNRLLLRAALRWMPLGNNHLQFAFGYGWTPNLSPYRDENRIWQQALYQDKFSPESANSYLVRLRTEQRDIEGTKQIAHRVRLMARFQHDFDTTYGYTVWDEFFLGLNAVPNGPRAGSDQNRIFVGPYIKFSNNVRFEPGYMRVDYPRGLSSDRLTNHVMSLNLFVDL